MDNLLRKSNEMTVSNSESEIVSIECSMCGDVGLKKQLFKCTSCLFRFQHTYCSSFYPNIELKRFSCDWCDYRVTKMVGRQVDSSGLNKFISNKRQSISASKQINVLTTMQKRGEECEEKSDLFISVNGRKRRQVKEKAKLQIHGGRRYKRLADLNS